jgi:response regulator RpfG family c-di-GMP phosphodiesterase
MKRILIVDDEVQILNALSRTFQETDYEIYTAEGSREAMKLLDAHDIHMVISDMRMPELDGYKLLSMIKEKSPNVIRIILSGYADERPMFQALLHNVAKLYVFKPWNNDDFLKNIDRLFADENELNSFELQDKLKEINCNCVMSEHCEKMLSLIEEENMDALIDEIDQNPEVSKLLLQVAKQGVYGAMPDKVKQVALYIGLHNLKSFMRFACAVSCFQSADTSEEPDLLIKHAYLTNRIFLFLFEVFLHRQPTESAMFAGLMHNIGLIIISPQEEVTAKHKPELSDYITMEYDQDQLLHQEVGAYYLDQWDLPFPVYETALYHHRPQDTNIINRELVSCVHIAQAYAWKTLGSENITVAPEVFEGIDISVSDFEKRLARYLK